MRASVEYHGHPRSPKKRQTAYMAGAACARLHAGTHAVAAAVAAAFVQVHNELKPGCSQSASAPVLMVVIVVG